MPSNTPELTRLEKLPTDIIHAIVSLLRPWEIIRFSCTSKRLRQACLPTLFRDVKFKFSLDGIENLKALLKSDVRSYVTCFTYEVTELLNTGMDLRSPTMYILTHSSKQAEILDFSYFRFEILTPDSYVDMAKAMYDNDEDSDNFPSYMSIYKTVCDVCREQCSTIDEGVDLLLSSVFCALPLLKEVRLSFCEALRDDQCLLERGIISEEPYQYHLEAVTSAIRSARRRDVAIHTISLYDFDLPYMHTWEESSLTIVSKSLRRLLQDMTVLRLRGSECIFKLLSHSALGIR